MNKIDNDRSHLARDAFRDADTDLIPDVSRLILRSDEMVLQARRAAATPEPDTLVDLVPLAWTMIPRFALGTAALVAISLGSTWFSETVSPTTDSTYELENLILGSESSSGGSDMLLNAITEREANDG
jgi:hypothetical protein